MTGGQRKLAVVGVSITWIVAALAIDRYFLRDVAPWFSNVLYLGNAEIEVKPFSRTFSWLGLALVMVAPSVTIGIGWSVYSAISRRRTILDSLALFGMTSFWFFFVPFLVWLGDVIYRFCKGFLDEWSWAK